MKNKISLFITAVATTFALSSCVTPNNSISSIEQKEITIYFDLGEYGLYNNKQGYSYSAYSITNGIKLSEEANTVLPGKESITSSNAELEFSCWEYYESSSSEATIVTTFKPSLHNKKVIASWAPKSAGDDSDNEDTKSEEDIGDSLYSDSSDTLPGGMEIGSLDDDALKKINIKIGYGYDVRCKLPIYDDNAIRVTNPILDQRSSKLKDSIYVERTSSQSARSIKTNSQTEMMQQYSSSVSAGISANVSVVNTNIDSLFDKQSSFSSIQRETYEIYSMVIKKARFLTQLNLENLKTVLDNSFRNDLYSVKTESDALRLFNTYGTHLLTGCSVGGVMEFSNYFATKSSSYQRQNKDSLKTQISAVVGSYGGGASFSFDQAYGNLENKNESVSNYNFISYGGKSVASMSIDHLFTYGQTFAEKGYEYGNWINSINDGVDLTIVSIPTQTPMLPLWNLLPSTSDYSATKQTLIDAYVKNCKSIYDEFISEHPDCVVTTLDADEEEFNNSFNLNGFLETKKSGYSNYQETENSFNETGLSVQIGSTVALNVATDSEIQRLTWSASDSNSGVITMIDENRGLFKVNDSSMAESFRLTLKVDDVFQAYLDFKISDVDPEYPTGGTGTKEDPLLISSKNEFINYIQKGTKFSKYAKLVSNIDLNNATISPFSGNLTGGFDGNYCSISNFNIRQMNSSALKSAGLFANNSGFIKNLTVDNACVVIGEPGSSSEFTNKINNVISQGSIKNASIICGYNKSGASIENCNVINSKLSVSVNENLADNIDFIDCGTIAGLNDGNISVVKSVDNKVNAELRDNITADVESGAVLGRNNGSLSIAEASNCLIEGHVFNGAKAKESKVGGIIGEACEASSSTNVLSYKTTIVSKATDKNTFRHQWCGGLIGFTESTSVIKNAVINDLLSISISGGISSNNKKGIVIGGRKSGTNVENSYYQEKSGLNAVGSGNTAEDKNGFSSSSNLITSGFFTDDSIWTSNDILGIVTKKVSSLSATIEKTEFVKGEKLIPGSISIEALFTNGDKENVTSFVVEGLYQKLDSISSSMKVTIEALGITTQVDISVIDSSPTSINIDLSRTRTEYFIGETITTDDFVMVSNWNNGEKDVVVDSNKIKIITTEYDLGKNRIVVSAYGFETHFDVTFSQREIDHVEASFKTSREWHEGDVIELTDIDVVIVYADGGREKAKSSQIELLNNIVSKGSHIVTICCCGYYIDTITIVGK